MIFQASDVGYMYNEFWGMPKYNDVYLTHFWGYLYGLLSLSVQFAHDNAQIRSPNECTIYVHINAL